MINNILLKIIHYSTYLALFTPLIVSPGFVYPFVLPKAIFFWVFSEIIFAAWLLLAIREKQYRPQENLLLYALGGFILIMLLASFRGVNVTLSFWSTFERMGGIVTLLHGFLLYIALSSTFRALRDWKKFFMVAVFVGAVASIVFFAEESVTNFLPKTRSGSTLGNSSFLGSYIIFPLFFAIYLFLKETGWKRGLVFVSGVLMIFTLYFANANAALLSFLGGVGLIFIAWLYFVKHETWNLKYVSGKKLATFLLAIGIFVGLLALYGTFTQDTRITEYLPDTFSSGGIGARKVVWDGAWEAVKERPVLGWGPENFYAAYAKYFNPCMPISSECGGEWWFDKAHNVVFDTLIAGGFAGLAAYLSIFLVAIYLLWRKALRVANKKLKPTKAWFLPSVITALLAAYFVQNLFVFDMPSTYLMFFFVLAFIAGITSGNEIEIDRNKVEISGNSIISTNFKLFQFISTIFLIISILSVSIYFLGYRSLQSAHYVHKSMHTRVPDIKERLNFYTASLAATPLGNLQTRESFTNNAIAWLQMEVDFDDQILHTIEEEAEKIVREYPAELRGQIVLGNFYNAMAKYFTLKRKDKNMAVMYKDKAQVVLERAMKLSPTNQKVYLSLSQTYIFKGDFRTAEELLQKAINLEPRYGEAHYNLGDLYMIIKKFEKAAKKFDEAIPLGYGASTVGKVANIARAYYETKQFAKAAKWYEKVVEKKPNDPEARWTLATIYKELGEYEKAKKEALVVKNLDAKYVETVDKFIEGLK